MYISQELTLRVVLGLGDGAGGTLLNVLGLGDGTVGGEGGGGGGGGWGRRKKMNWSYGRPGWIGNEVISPAWYCLLL